MQATSVLSLVQLSAGRSRSSDHADLPRYGCLRHQCHVHFLPPYIWAIGRGMGRTARVLALLRRWAAAIVLY